MMRTRHLAPLAALILIAACSGDDNGPSSNTDTSVTDTGTGDSGGTDATSDAPTDDADSGGGSETGSDAETDGDTTGPGDPFSEAEIFYACVSDDECGVVQGRQQICVHNVCVIPPTRAGYLSDDEGDLPEEHAGDTPIVECFRGERGIFEPVGDDRDITLVGKLTRFGSGPATTGLCVTIYDEAALLPWLYFSECNDLADDDEDGYIACFQLDPCRCQETFVDGLDINDAMVEAAESALSARTGTTARINSLDSCNSFIGYCSAIEDPEIAAECRTRVAENALAPGLDSLIRASQRTTEDVEDRDSEDPEGSSLFAFENVPTNWRFAYKVSGRENRWRDTWTYGKFTRGDVVRDDGTLLHDATAVSAGAWATIPPAVGLAGGIPNTNGALAGVIRDCGDSDRNPWAVVQATVGISFSQGSVLSYFNGNPNDRLPLPGRSDTNVLGTYAAINLPPGPNRVAPIVCVGDCTDRDNFIFVGGINVFQTPKSVIIASFQGFFQE